MLWIYCVSLHDHGAMSHIRQQYSVIISVDLVESKSGAKELSVMEHDWGQLLQVLLFQEYLSLDNGDVTYEVRSLEQIMD
jgi:hypothetical protein